MGTGELRGAMEVEIRLVATCQRNQDRLQRDGPLSLYSDLPSCCHSDLLLYSHLLSCIKILL